MNKQFIKTNRKDIENWHTFERKKLLTELGMSYLKQLKELSEQCSLTGEWPMKYKYCGVSK